MAQQTLTRAEISEHMAVKVGISRQRATKILEDVLEEMIKALVTEGHLKLSSFGSFTILHKKNRIGRNPKTRKEVMITPRKTVSFRASHILKERILKKA